MPVCGNFIGLRCNFDKNGSNVITKLGACEIYDDLPMNYYTIFSKITSFTYNVNDPAMEKTWESTELGCYNELFTAIYKKDGFEINQPGFINFNGASRKFDVYT